MNTKFDTIMEIMLYGGLLGSMIGLGYVLLVVSATVYGQ